MGVDSDPFYGAPTVVLVFGNPKVNRNYVRDASLVMGNLMMRRMRWAWTPAGLTAARKCLRTRTGKPSFGNGAHPKIWSASVSAF